jgi:hypothetical protein
VSYPQHGPQYHYRESWKVPCRAATRFPITISTDLNNGDTLDGVTLATGDRVLVKDQSTASQNGIYVVGASPARAADFAAGEVIVGSAVVVSEGTVNGGKAWLCDAPAPIIVGTDDITFAALGSGGGGIDPHITGTGTGSIDFPAATGTIHAYTAGLEAGLELDEGGSATLFAGLVTNAFLEVKENLSRLYTPHTPASLSGEGLAIQVGDDTLSLLVGEKDAATVQVYSYVDVELHDNTGVVFKHVSEAGDESIPSLGRLRVLASAPGSPVEGDSYYDSTLHKTRTYDGTTWQNHF